MKNTSNTVKLSTPIKRGDKEITEITLREPSAGELRGVSLANLLQMEVGTVSKVLERVSEPTLDAAALADLPARDLTSLSLELVNFFVDTTEASPSA
ncbi:phage tail assembly protein [Methylocaldum sp. MU1018]